MAMSTNTINVLNYLKAHNTEMLTASDVADALGVDVKVVNCSFTSGIARKQLGARVEAEVEYTADDGSTKHKTMKFLKLTDAGMAFDPEATED